MLLTPALSMHAPPITGNKSWRCSFKTSRLEAILTIGCERDSATERHHNACMCVNETIMQSWFSFNVSSESAWGHKLGDCMCELDL